MTCPVCCAETTQDASLPCVTGDLCECGECGGQWLHFSEEVMGRILRGKLPLQEAWKVKGRWYTFGKWEGE